MIVNSRRQATQSSVLALIRVAVTGLTALSLSESAHAATIHRSGRLTVSLEWSSEAQSSLDVDTDSHCLRSGHRIAGADLGGGPA